MSGDGELEEFMFLSLEDCAALRNAVLLIKDFHTVGLDEDPECTGLHSLILALEKTLSTACKLDLGELEVAWLWAVANGILRDTEGNKRAKRTRGLMQNVKEAAEIVLGEKLREVGPPELH